MQVENKIHSWAENWVWAFCTSLQLCFWCLRDHSTLSPHAQNLRDTSSRSSCYPCDTNITGYLFLDWLQTPTLGSRLGWTFSQNDRPAFGSFCLLPRGWLWEVDQKEKISDFLSEICWPQQLYHAIFEKFSRFRLNFSVIIMDEKGNPFIFDL